MKSKEIRHLPRKTLGHQVKNADTVRTKSEQNRTSFTGQLLHCSTRFHQKNRASTSSLLAISGITNPAPRAYPLQRTDAKTDRQGVSNSRFDSGRPDATPLEQSKTVLLKNKRLLREVQALLWSSVGEETRLRCHGRLSPILLEIRHGGLTPPRRGFNEFLVRLLAAAGLQIHTCVDPVCTA
ncbi:MAG: hypothetical protein ACOY3E_10930 [Pseudomonadota bacterium]